MRRRPWASCAGARLPVMVWIHGGGYAGGTGSRYDGSHFAADGVVFVAINYRLGRLGFFAHPAIARTSPDGNLADFGLMDQIAALKWVKDNIAAFGGDPANVTVFGESAGAASVNALLVSPKARGLFAKAISESSFAAIAPATLAQARAAAVSFAEGLGIKAEDPIEVAAALRGRTASAYGARVPPLSDPGAPKPILDGVVLARDPLVAFARGEQARVPLIIGGNSFEASLFADPIAAALESGGGQPGWNPATDLAAFGAGDPAKAAADFITLSRVIEPDRRLARDDAEAGVPAFVYYFSYVPEAMRAHVQGASHGAEISYVFGSIHKDAAPADTAIGRAMHAYWVAFAKTGRPDVKGAVVWPAVSPKDDVLLEFGVDGVRPRRDFDKARLDLLEARAVAAEGKP
jgi:para-nitrobenzyl esterase